MVSYKTRVFKYDIFVILAPKSSSLSCLPSIICVFDNVVAVDVQFFDSRRRKLSYKDIAFLATKVSGYSAEPK